MAQGHDDADETKGSLIDRRSYLKLAGAAGAALAGAGSATASTSVAADEVVDLGNQGLSEGDLIDPYLDEYFENGVEVRIPEGEYDWNGGGLQRSSIGNAAVVGEGEVIFTLSSSRFYETIRATSGTVALRNFTIRGAVTDETRFRLETDDDARILIENVNFPDGVVDDAGRAQALYVPPAHAGLIEFHNCYVSKFSDNGIYASPPGKGEGGTVIIDSCVAHNNNITGFRIGGSGSAVRNSLVINDDRAPIPSGIGHNQRGIRIGESTYSKDIRIENCDIIHSGTDLGGGIPIRWSYTAGNSTGHIETVRILNNNGDPAVLDYGSASEGWTATDVHVTGDGSYEVPDWFTDVYTGDDADEPSATLPDEQDWATLGFITAEDAGETGYELIVDGDIRPITWQGYETPSGNYALATSNYEITTLDDGRYRVEGYSGNGWGDAYEIDGDVVEASLESTEDSWFELEFEEVTPGELVDRTPLDDGGDDGDDGSGDDDGGGDDGDDSNEQEWETLGFITAEDGGETGYELIVDGDVEPITDQSYETPSGNYALATSNYEITTLDDGRYRVEGYSGNGWGDAYEISGDVVEASLESTEDSWFELEFEEVTPDELVALTGDESDDGSGDGDGDDDGSGDDGDDDQTLSNVLIVDGTGSDDVTRYTFTVTGEVERDDAISSVPSDAMAWDEIEDQVGEDEVVGIVGKGIDGYRYSGELVGFEFDGAAELTIESSDL